MKSELEDDIITLDQKNETDDLIAVGFYIVEVVDRFYVRRL